MMEGTESPFKKFWDILSTFGGVIGLASLADGIINWIGFLNEIILWYQNFIRPMIDWLPELLSLPNWFSDYLFIGAMIVSSRMRPGMNAMKGSWKINVEIYKWYMFWAPHRVAYIVLTIFCIFIWPLFALIFLPPKIIGFDEGNEFNNKLYKEQYFWLGIYSLSFICLVILNTALELYYA